MLVRHAQTHSNVARALDTALPGADLTELGEQQVAELAASLAEERIDVVYCSPALRALRTAQGLAEPRGLTPLVRPALVEISAGDWEMSTSPEHWQGYGDVVSRWFDHDLDHGMPGGELGTAAIARVDEVVAEILASDVEHAAIVSHGGLLRSWCAVRVPNVTAELARAHPLSNTGVVRLTGTTGSWHAVSWDDLSL